MGTEAQGNWQPDPYGGASWRLWDGAAWGTRTAPATPDGGFAPLRSVIGSQVVLARPAAANEADLMLGQQWIARIQRSGPGNAEAHCSEGSWLFEGNAVTGERRTIRVLPSGVEIGRFEWGDGSIVSMPGSHGMLTFVDGRHLRFPRTSELHGRRGGLLDDLRGLAEADWTILGPSNVPLLRSQYAPGGTDGPGRVGAGPVWLDVYPQAADAIELPLLVLLTAFLTWSIGSSTEARRRLRNEF